MIYAIQAGESGPIKFGVARNPNARLGELQTGNAIVLKIIALADVDHSIEGFIHRHLEADHEHGEWFRPSPRALGVVDAMRRQQWSSEHVLVNYIYDADLSAVVWYRRRLGAKLDIFEHERYRAGAEGVAYSTVRASLEHYMRALVPENTGFNQDSPVYSS